MSEFKKLLTLEGTNDKKPLILVIDNNILYNPDKFRDCITREKMDTYFEGLKNIKNVCKKINNESKIIVPKIVKIELKRSLEKKAREIKDVDNNKLIDGIKFLLVELDKIVDITKLSDNQHKLFNKFREEKMSKSYGISPSNINDVEIIFHSIFNNAEVILTNDAKIPFDKKSIMKIGNFIIDSEGVARTSPYPYPLKKDKHTLEIILLNRIWGYNDSLIRNIKSKSFVKKSIYNDKIMDPKITFKQHPKCIKRDFNKNIISWHNDGKKKKNFLETQRFIFDNGDLLKICRTIKLIVRLKKNDGKICDFSKYFIDILITNWFPINKKGLSFKEYCRTVGSSKIIKLHYLAKLDNYIDLPTSVYNGNPIYFDYFIGQKKLKEYTDKELKEFEKSWNINETGMNWEDYKEKYFIPSNGKSK